LCLAIGGLPSTSGAQTYVIPFSDIRQAVDTSTVPPDEAINAYLAAKLREELDALGFNVDGGLVLDQIPVPEITQEITDKCIILSPYKVHTDPTTATVTIDDSSSLTVNFDTIRSITLFADLIGSVSTSANAWVKWGIDIPFIDRCSKVNTDHGWVGLDLPFSINLNLALDLDPIYDSEQVAIVVDKHAMLSGQIQVTGGNLQHDFGSLSLTDLLIDIFEDELLEALQTSASQSVADAVTKLNRRLDGLDENGVPDPTIEAFNAPTVFVIEANDEDQAFIRGLLEEFGVPDLVLSMVDERGVEILLQLVVLDSAQRDAYLASLGAEISCDAILDNFAVTLDSTPIFTLNGQSCSVANLSGPPADAYYSDTACTNEVAFRPTDDLDFCLAQVGDQAESLLGNAASWAPEPNQPNDPLPSVESRAWTSVPSTRLDLGVISVQGNHQPYMKQLKYKTISGLPRGSGTCELEMRVYKQDIVGQDLDPVLAFHGGTWRHRGSSFLGMEAGISHLTERGFVVFAPFYRLVGDSDGNVECNAATWRELTADVESALDWVRTNGAAFGATDGPVKVYGQSAGAHLAGWLAAHRPDDVERALLYYAPLDALDFLSGAVPFGGPYEAFRDFGQRALTRLYGARSDSGELNLDLINYAGISVAHLNENWASVIPAAVFDLSKVDMLAPPGYLARCANATLTDLSSINPSMPPAALIDCLKQDVRDFLIENSLIHQLADEAVPVFAVHGSADSLVPYAQPVKLCGAIDGSVLPSDVIDPLTAYACGTTSAVHIIRDAEHAFELAVCVPPLCPAGAPGSDTRTAAASSILESYAWFQEAALRPPVATFADVPPDHWAFTFIETIAAAGITGGCGNGNFCPDALINRAQMAIFLERGMRGGSYAPPPATGTVFSDVPATHFAAAFIEQLRADGITGGCGGGKYCPSNNVSNAHMAIFLLRAVHGAGYRPPPATGAQFTDVSASYWAAAWIEQLAREGITSGCGNGNYCPNAAINRAGMAMLLVRAFGL
jgi:acetyl esterase/lipase